MTPTISGAARSKTIWLGATIAVIGYLQMNMDAISPFLPPQVLGLVNVLLGAAVVAVRFITSESLASKGGE